MEGLCGFTAVRGYPDDVERLQVPSVVHMDAASGPGAALALLAALHYRERTGQGQFIEFAQSENMLPHLGEFFLDAQMNQRDACPLGNHHPRMAPHNVYPCAGEGTWVTIAVADDAEWQRLCAALGQPDWADASTFSDYGRSSGTRMNSIRLWRPGRASARQPKLCTISRRMG